VRAVLLRVVASCLGVMVSSMCGMAVRGMGVVRGLLVIATLVVLGSLTMMMSSPLVVLGGLVVMLGSLMGHGCVSPQALRIQGDALPCVRNVSRPHDRSITA
jgi:hypothetical protein